MTAGALPPSTLTLHGPCAVRGRLRVPGDKSISHRALLLSAMAPGLSTIRGLSTGDDVVRTRRAVEQLGAAVTDTEDGTVTVCGGDLTEPSTFLDHGNSGTGIRLMAGLVSGLDVYAVLTGDEFLRCRPMGRVTDPLREMGARIDGRAGGSLAPLAIRGGRLRGIRYQSPVASAQVKSAILLAGLRATGETTVVERTVTRRHTEEMLATFGVEVRVEGTAVTVAPSTLAAASVQVPGDPSQAAYWVIAGVVASESDVVVEDLYLGHGRSGFLTVLRGLGAEVDVDAGGHAVRTTVGHLTGLAVGTDEAASFIDEIPILAVAAASARGRTVFGGVEELRVKESDRIATTAAMLRAFGVEVAEAPDGLAIEGARRLRGAEIDAGGDHRIAMAAAIAALRAEGTTVVRGWEAVSTSYPDFAAELNRLTGGAARAEATTDGD